MTLTSISLPYTEKLVFQSLHLEMNWKNRTRQKTELTDRWINPKALMEGLLFPFFLIRIQIHVALPNPSYFNIIPGKSQRQARASLRASDSHPRVRYHNRVK